MAIRYYAVTRRAAYDKVRHGFDSASSAVTAALGAVDTALDEAVDAALAQEDIDASEAAEAAVEAIRTDVTQALAGAESAISAALTTQGGDVVVMFDDSVITRRDELRRALEQVLRTLEGSDALSS